MTFSIYVLLGEDAPRISSKSLAEDFKAHFSSEKGFSLEFDQLPFSDDISLALRWDHWLARVTYEEGEVVAEDSAEIAKLAGRQVAKEISEIDRRVRLVFGDDEEMKYTNEVIYLMDFFREIKGAFLFDPQKKEMIL